MIVKKFRLKWLVKKLKLIRRKKNHPEHKYSVTFVTKVETQNFSYRHNILFSIAIFEYKTYCCHRGIYNGRENADEIEQRLVEY